MTSIPADVQTLIAQEMALGHYESEADLLRDALGALRVERESKILFEDEEVIASIQRGLDDAAAGRGKTIEEFDRDFRARHGIGEDV